VFAPAFFAEDSEFHAPPREFQAPSRDSTPSPNNFTNIAIEVGQVSTGQTRSRSDRQPLLDSPGQSNRMCTVICLFSVGCCCRKSSPRVCTCTITSRPENVKLPAGSI
jgi:hypothetical protein